MYWKNEVVVCELCLEVWVLSVVLQLAEELSA